MRASGAFSVILFFMIFGSIYANIYFVDCSDQNSSDNNAGTINSPFKTIQRAADIACAGDTVFIRQGVYNEGFRTVNNGSAAFGHVIISSYSGEKVVIDGADVNTTNTAVLIQNNYFKLIGIEIRNWDTGIWMDGAGFAEISDCEVHDVIFGVGASNGTHDFTLNSVMIHHFDLYGFDASPSGGSDCYNGTLINCTAHTGRDAEQNVDGFALGHGTQDNFKFINCTAYNVFDGFDISSQNVILDRCLTYDCWNGGYKLWQDNIKLVNAISYNCNISNVELDWDGQPGAVSLMNCTFYGAKVFSIWVENNSDTLRMYNCIVSGGDNIGLAFEQAGELNYYGDYNIFHSNNSARAVSVGYTDEFSVNQLINAEWADFSGQDSHSVAVDSLNTLFVDFTANDFHLKKTAEAVDAGTSINAPVYDFDGNTRPSGKAWDIGSYEYQFSTGVDYTAKNNTSCTTLKNLRNFPNPFNSETKINFILPEQCRVVVNIYDIMGREIITLVNEERAAGRHEVLWDGKNSAGQPAASGMYFYQIKFREKIITKKMMLLR